jgi:hypothetical protein
VGWKSKSLSIDRITCQEIPLPEAKLSPGGGWDSEIKWGCSKGSPMEWLLDIWCLLNGLLTTMKIGVYISKWGKGITPMIS